MGKYNLCIILGNGFDLDLSLPTKYNQFLDSDIYKNINFTSKNKIDVYYDKEMYQFNEYDNLFDYLSSCKNDKNWIDIEKELLFLAQREVETYKGDFGLAYSTDDEHKAFKLLSLKLCEYLRSINYDSINKESSAYKLLYSLQNLIDANVEILTFNYTDLYQLDIMKSLKVPIRVDHVHGSILDNSAILGFQDEAEINKSYSYMIKSFNPNFKSHNVNYKLKMADEIIFFGHSLGITDYHYFQHFFRTQSSPDLMEKPKIIRIITWNYNSQIDVLYQLRHMNEKHTDLLYDLNDFEVLRTSDNQDKIISYFRQMVNRCNKGPKNLKALETMIY